MISTGTILTMSTHINLQVVIIQCERAVKIKERERLLLSAMNDNGIQDALIVLISEIDHVHFHNV